MLRLFGIPESEIAETLRRAEDGRGGPVGARDHDLPAARRGRDRHALRRRRQQATYDAFATIVRERHAATLFSDDGTSVDEQVAALLTRAPARTVATAESCTGGLVAARLTELPGSSAYVRGGLVVYSNEAKTELAGVDPGADRDATARCPRRSPARWPTARSRAWAPTSASGSPASRARTAGRDEKPVGLVWISVAERDGGRIDRKVNLPGARADVRDRTTTVALHLLRRVLLGLGDLQV